MFEKPRGRSCREGGGVDIHEMSRVACGIVLTRYLGKLLRIICLNVSIYIEQLGYSKAICKWCASEKMYFFKELQNAR